MGCYGIGISRVMGILVEKFHDEKGIMWPSTVAPYAIHLVSLANKDEELKKKAEEVYHALENAGVSVLYDDREDAGTGQKFADADLLGLPVRLVVSAKTGEDIEWKKRNEDSTELLPINEVIQRLQNQKN